MPPNSHAHSDHEASRSYASFRSHPLHPMLVPLPIGAFVFLLVTDVTYTMTGEPFWAEASFWLVVAGVISGLVAGLVGAVDFASIRHARHQIGWIHFIGNVALLLVGMVNWYLRTGEARAEAIWPWGLALTLVTAAILGVTGWAGGELSYRYKVGVLPNSDKPTHPS